jgi:hypothetical protein
MPIAAEPAREQIGQQRHTAHREEKDQPKHRQKAQEE